MEWLCDIMGLMLHDCILMTIFHVIVVWKDHVDYILWVRCDLKFEKPCNTNKTNNCALLSPSQSLSLLVNCNTRNHPPPLTHALSHTHSHARSPNLNFTAAQLLLAKIFMLETFQKSGLVLIRSNFKILTKINFRTTEKQFSRRHFDAFGIYFCPMLRIPH